MRLIDADALIEFIVEEAQDLRTLSTKTVGQAISKTPTVDAVPVIRCKDCKFSMSGIDKYNERYILCQLHERSYGVIDDGFCKWAERKEE